MWFYSSFLFLYSCLKSKILLLHMLLKFLSFLNLPATTPVLNIKVLFYGELLLVYFLCIVNLLLLLACVRNSMFKIQCRYGGKYSMRILWNKIPNATILSNCENVSEDMAFTLSKFCKYVLWTCNSQRLAQTWFWASS